jgi:hypothetical protein
MRELDGQAAGRDAGAELELRRRVQQLLRATVVTLLALLEGTDPSNATAVTIAQVGTAHGAGWKRRIHGCDTLLAAPFGSQRPRQHHCRPL